MRVRRRMFVRVGLWSGLGLMISAIFLLSSQRHPLGDDVSLGILWGRGDLLFHLGEYCALGLLFYAVITYENFTNQRKRVYLMVVFATMLVGGVDEIYQGTVSGRTASASDFAADVMGAIVAILMILVGLSLPRYARFLSQATLFRRDLRD